MSSACFVVVVRMHYRHEGGNLGFSGQDTVTQPGHRRLEVLMNLQAISKGPQSLSVLPLPIATVQHVQGRMDSILSAHNAVTQAIAPLIMDVAIILEGPRQITLSTATRSAGTNKASVIMTR